MLEVVQFTTTKFISLLSQNLEVNDSIPSWYRLNITIHPSPWNRKAILDIHQCASHAGYTSQAPEDETAADVAVLLYNTCWRFENSRPLQL